MSYAVGSLVRARGREWVVLPESEEELLILRPLGGTEDEVTGICLSIENVEPAQFDLPDPDLVGDYRSCRLLRDALRFGFRSSAGPFRSFAKITVEPRPYQLLPLLMALKLDPVRILIADDVGIGKTVEACLIARELIDRGEALRLAVLSPPHLAEQWQAELLNKFHIETELVLSSTATRLEKQCGLGQSLFEVFPHVIVSTDFIKTDRRRDEFLRTCPELVIVDEAHTCALADQGRASRHQRYQLLKGLSADPGRHLILVTATPHSGKEDAFRSLLTFLDKDFANLPADLAGKGNEHHRRRLAAHFVQRRRADIRYYLQAETPFPEREEAEENYQLSSSYRQLFDRVLRYARETVKESGATQHRQRVRWWSVLALLRSMASSPAAAAATLRSRAAVADTETPEDADEIGRRTVLDLDLDETADGIDVIPGSDTGEQTEEDMKNRQILLKMARTADGLNGDKDAKLMKAVKLIQNLLKDGYHPIVFCRFIPTAEYVAAQLRERLSKRVEVAAVTGILPPSEREERILQLAKEPQRVLVATDCLSEGINLQEYFDAVFHYDLSWNPTRHEQREGRVDRYGQPRRKVRVLTFYGTDNQIDGIVLDVLLRKHKKIRSSLGISVPVPVDTNSVVEAVLEGLLLKEQKGAQYQQLTLFDEYLRPAREDLFAKWDDATAREKRSRTMFAQESIKVDEVAHELEAVQRAIGSGAEVEWFIREGFRACSATVAGNSPLLIDLQEAPTSLIEEVGGKKKIKVQFQLPVKDGVLYLNRTHPVVEGLGSFIMNTALDPLLPAPARRCGIICTSQVDCRTTVLLVRFRYHIVTRQGGLERPLLAEDCQVLAFAGSPQSAQWLENAVAETLLQVEPEANISPSKASEFVRRVIDGFDRLRPHLEEAAWHRGRELLEAHRRVRTASRHTGVSYRVEPQLPPDVLGIYIYLPKD
ncbi:DEAD/DEAH box helicase [Pelotomaculum terephthalicicum JT]|uniref:helicase-related protein n=1 Tax=Pelotomaculum terephthalicicum TaxID=206393 RepID=UPI001F045688|nr:helicase-related protein [Pelotomaculum terephthalicicum]MCG9969578.1 DEAD/DEAH box helicase [Pelotomaculum terephthalicicum JT]